MNTPSSEAPTAPSAPATAAVSAETAPSDSFLAVRNLRSGYWSWRGHMDVLNGVDLTAQPGAITALVGNNGQGKTTLFRVLMGLHPFLADECTIEGNSPARYRETKGIGFLPDGVSPPPAFSCWDFLALGADMTTGEVPREDLLEEAIDRTGLPTADLKRRLTRVSKGMRQRVYLAYSLMGNPRFVMLDEPFSGLDPSSRMALRDQLIEMRATGATILVASHDLAEVVNLADQVWILANGVTHHAPEPASASQAELERLLRGGYA